MRSPGLFGLALAGLLLVASATRADKQTPPDKPPAPEPVVAFKPAALLRIEPLDDLIADQRYLFKQAGQESAGERLEDVLKGLTGAAGENGIDTKKPIALYATVASKLDQSQVMLMLPIADQKKFISFLEDRGFKTEKDGDVYTLKIENVPFPILFRFAHGYLYGMPRFTKNTRLPGKDKLPTPATVMAGGSGVLSLTANVDRIPEQVRKLAVSAAALQLGNMKEEKLPNETDAQQELRGAVLDELAAQVKSLLEEAGPINLKLDVDRKKHDLTLSLSVAGKPDTDLAKNIAALGQTKSLAASLLGKDSALGGFANVTLPPEVVKQLGPVVDEGFKKGLDRLDDDTRELVEPLVKAVEKTVKSGQLDLAVDFRGPRKNGRYTILACGQVKDGDRIEAALRKVVEKLAEEQRKPIKLDADRASGVNIHRVAQKKVDSVTKAMLGDGPLYFAIRKDAVVVSMGDEALAALKSALALEPKAAGTVRLEGSLSRIAKLMARHQKGAEKAAKQAFKEKGSDRVSLFIGAGKTLEVKFTVKSSVLKFAGLLDQARKDSQQDDQ
jgi:hypothetical protein